MKYCPACGSEYFDNINQCADCDMVLVSEEEYLFLKSLEKSPDFEKVLVLDNPFEADIVSDSCRREGIDFIITRHEETAYNGIFIPQKGWGVLSINSRDIDRSRPIIDAVISLRKAVDSPDPDDTGEKNDDR